MMKAGAALRASGSSLELLSSECMMLIAIEQSARASVK
jgi:hypothetical protein